MPDRSESAPKGAAHAHGLSLARESPASGEADGARRGLRHQVRAKQARPLMPRSEPWFRGSNGGELGGALPKPTISSIDHKRSDTPAAIAGVTRSVLWMRTTV